ncbi:hypothetical protein CIPAW_09G087500 [Carya illinoinensis]|uniref:Uncharacterized protein n=1 Tax=Carya illinoinensis TaxID=32201 RepID=A0A8T1PKN7_CARIL|nr:hypothetical protein CIPAW_09G087500 [Carya illinoinensis]
MDGYLYFNTMNYPAIVYARLRRSTTWWVRYRSSTRGVNFVDNVIYLVHDLHRIPIL